MTREELAALVNECGHFSTTRISRRGRRLTVLLAPLTEAEAVDVASTVEGARLLSRHPQRPEACRVAVHGVAALALIDDVVDLLGPRRQAEVTATLDAVDVARANVARALAWDERRAR